jgi:hypothetical protein
MSQIMKNVYMAQGFMALMALTGEKQYWLSTKGSDYLKCQYQMEKERRLFTCFTIVMMS